MTVLTAEAAGFRSIGRAIFDLTFKMESLHLGRPAFCTYEGSNLGLWSRVRVELGERVRVDSAQLHCSMQGIPCLHADRCNPRQGPFTPYPPPATATSGTPGRLGNLLAYVGVIKPLVGECLEHPLGEKATLQILCVRTAQQGHTGIKKTQTIPNLKPGDGPCHKQ